jgi:hypothetical protein
VNSLSEKNEQERKKYYDADPDGVRQVLDKQIGYVNVTRRNDATGKWVSAGYLAWSRSGNTLRIMIAEKEGE